MFLAAERGIPHDSQQHAAYVGSWIRALKSDKHEIFRAAGDASRAADYLLALERERSFAGQSLSADDTRPTAFQRETAALDRDRSDLDERPVPVRDEARAIAKDALGAKAKMIDAETQSGSYRGVVLGETVDRIVQRQSSQSAVFHLKAALGSIPAVGANIAIQYSNGHGAVREVRQRSKTVEMGR